MKEPVDTLYFEIRYASRVLELQARFWRKLDATIKFCSLLSSTAAFGSIVSGRPRLTLFFGVVFALLQATEFVLSPSGKALEANEARRLYKPILASDARDDQKQLEKALLVARSKDDVTVFESLRRIAYNDVAHEIGRPDSTYELTKWQRIISLLA